MNTNAMYDVPIEKSGSDTTSEYVSLNSVTFFGSHRASPTANLRSFDAGHSPSRPGQPSGCRPGSPGGADFAQMVALDTAEMLRAVGVTSRCSNSSSGAAPAPLAWTFGSHSAAEWKLPAGDTQEGQRITSSHEALHTLNTTTLTNFFSCSSVETAGGGELEAAGRLASSGDPAAWRRLMLSLGSYSVEHGVGAGGTDPAGHADANLHASAAGPQCRSATSSAAGSGLKFLPISAHIPPGT